MTEKIQILAMSIGFLKKHLGIVLGVIDKRYYFGFYKSYFFNLAFCVCVFGITLSVFYKDYGRKLK